MKDLSLLHAALSDPTRLRLLSLMKNGEVCVCYLQEILQTNQPKVSRHLAYLKRAGLVETRRDGKWIHYRLKKLENNFDQILSETLAHLGHEVQIKQDLERLKQAGY